MTLLIDNTKLFSQWWIDVCCLDRNGVENGNWFEQGVRRQVGNGKDTSFWKDDWIGQGLFQDLFARIFVATLHKDALVSDVWMMRGDTVNWNLQWKRNLFVWGNNLVQELISYANSIGLRLDQKDNWIWKYEQSELFTVKSIYKVLSNL